ncbi:MAG TPA: DUF1156 domain-containing protein [Opitutaceae bacterium]|nr:DUF1156 domain-containing protein [Opitutaceae bacterium]
MDFPIVPINEIAQIEGNAGKPIYQMSKWWARRRSSVFRAMLLAAATKAPDDESEAASKIWKAYYGNHQNNPAFQKLQVGDLFMGGGTTLVEGSRLGMNLFGCDLNPVAWFVVKNEVTPVDVEEVKRLFAEIEAEVKPFLMPYFTCDGPEGEKGVWFKRSATAADGWEKLPVDFDIWTVPWQERPQYRYEGPEIIYTFWAKHGPCESLSCGHRTPLMTTPVIAIKTLTVKHWSDFECDCGKTFDVEQFPARMAPDASLAIAPDEKPFASMNARGEFTCPHCGKVHTDLAGRLRGDSISLGGKASNKKVELTLLMHPDWLKGCGPTDAEGHPLGGSATDDVESTIRWYRERAKTLCLVEVRGKLPETVTCPETGVTFSTGSAGGNVPKRSTFECQAPTCGRQQDVMESTKKTGKPAPLAPYVIQGYSSKRDKDGHCYGGRFFAKANCRLAAAAANEWFVRSHVDLRDFWPETAVEAGAEIGKHDVEGHGYKHWWKMFNPTQLLIHSQILRAIVTKPDFSEPAGEVAFGALQQYLRNQNSFTLWNIAADKLEPMFSSGKFQPKSTTVENNVFGEFGRGNWNACACGIVEGIEWKNNVHELVGRQNVARSSIDLAQSIQGKSVPILTRDVVRDSVKIYCGSATNLNGNILDQALDIIITDPPFGELIQYAELSEFFYAWLRLALRGRYPEHFAKERTPKALEAVENSVRQSNPSEDYKGILQGCWMEAYRTLKPGGILAFTFHHSKDKPWVDVLEGLFCAGFYLETTYPVRSDEIKGDKSQFGSQQIEYDIIHVCRKRRADPVRISWARLRRRIMDDVRALKSLLEQHQSAGLPEADLRVIKRGKALEYYSQHYGQVFVEQGREFTLREALVGINQLIDDEDEKSADAPPVTAEAFSRQFLRIFRKTDEVPNDQLQKFLRGTGMSPADFEKRGWCDKDGKTYRMVEPLAWARAWKGQNRKGMSRDLDQTLFLIGASYADSGIKVWDTLNSPNFLHHPAIPDLLSWFGKNGANQTVKEAAYRAQRLYEDWMERNKPAVQALQVEFGFTEEVA